MCFIKDSGFPEFFYFRTIQSLYPITYRTLKFLLLLHFMEIINNKKQFRFELPLPGGEFAELNYRWLKGSMVLMHTVVPSSARGKGIGGILVKYVLDYAREQHLKIINYCHFVTKYLNDHPEYNDLIDGIHKK